MVPFTPKQNPTNNSFSKSEKEEKKRCMYIETKMIRCTFAFIKITKVNLEVNLTDLLNVLAFLLLVVGGIVALLYENKTEHHTPRKQYGQKGQKKWLYRNKSFSIWALSYFQLPTLNALFDEVETEVDVMERSMKILCINISSALDVPVLVLWTRGDHEVELGNVRACLV